MSITALQSIPLKETEQTTIEGFFRDLIGPNNKKRLNRGNAMVAATQTLLA